MLSKKALREFEERELRDYSFIKEVGARKLRAQVASLIRGTGFEFKTKPYLHQLASFFLMVCNDEFLLLLDMGLGKTKISLDAFAFRKQIGEAERALVTVPSSVNIEGWNEEIEIHSDLSSVMLCHDNETNWKILNEAKGSIYIINYPSLWRLLTNNKDGKLVKNPTKVRRLNKLFDFLIQDEIHLAKNKKSLTFRLCRAMGKGMQYSYGMTGTPFGRDPIDLWAQFYLVDGGDTLGDTLGIYRQAYFNEVEGWSGHTKYEFNNRNERKLYKALHNKSIRYSDEECLDLPKKVPKTIHVRFTPDIRKHYDNVINGLINYKGKTEKLKGVFWRLRELTSGFITLKDDEENKEIIKFPCNPKLEALEDLVQDISLKRKMIIFLELVPSAEMVEELLTKLKFKFASVRGATKDSIAEIRKFKHDASVRFLVANSKSIAAGGNYQVANYGVFYETPTSPIVRKQCIKRIWRNKQTRTTFIYDLEMIGKESIDTKIFGYLDEGKDLYDAIIEGGKTFKKVNRKRIQLI